MTERPGYFAIIRGDGVALGADGALQPPKHRSRPISPTKELNRDTQSGSEVVIMRA
jgi:hypothetical protein